MPSAGNRLLLSVEPLVLQHRLLWPRPTTSCSCWREWGRVGHSWMPSLITMWIMWITMWMPSLNDENRYVCMSALLHLAMRGQTGLVRTRKHNSTISRLYLTDVFVLLGKAGFANSSNAVGLLPHHLPSLHDGGGALQRGGHEVQLEGPCSGKTTPPKVLNIFHRTLRPSGTPPYFSLTRRHKNCWQTFLQPLSSPLSLTCSSQVLCCPQIVSFFPNIIGNVIWNP